MHASLYTIIRVDSFESIILHILNRDSSKVHTGIHTDVSCFTEWWESKLSMLMLHTVSSSVTLNQLYFHTIGTKVVLLVIAQLLSILLQSNN